MRIYVEIQLYTKGRIFFKAKNTRTKSPAKTECLNKLLNIRTKQAILVILFSLFVIF